MCIIRIETSQTTAWATCGFFVIRMSMTESTDWMQNVMVKLQVIKDLEEGRVAHSLMYSKMKRRMMTTGLTRIT